MQQYPLLPPVMKHFGFACADLQHPAHPRLTYNYEREWAWSVCCAFMTEKYVAARAFLQPSHLVAYLQPLVTKLPDATMHLSERSSSHVPWIFERAVGLMVVVKLQKN